MIIIIIFKNSIGSSIEIMKTVWKLLDGLFSLLYYFRKHYSKHYINN